MSPTQRSLKSLRSNGWTAVIVEHWNSHAHRRIDFANFADIIAFSREEGIVAIQTTTGANLAARIAKIKEEPRAAVWLASGGRIMAHGWRKVGPRGKTKHWECREIEVTAESLAVRYGAANQKEYLNVHDKITRSAEPDLFAQPDTAQSDARAATR